MVSRNSPYAADDIQCVKISSPETLAQLQIPSQYMTRYLHGFE